MIVVVVAFFNRDKTAQGTLNIPEIGRTGTASKHQKRFLDERGLSGFEDTSKEQASLIISCVRYAERVSDCIGNDEEIKSTSLVGILVSITNDDELRDFIHERNQKLWKSGIDEDDVDPDQDEHFFKVKKFIEKA